MKFTRETLTSWILANLRLSRTDRHFYSKVETNIALGKITTNQATLWNTLLKKYNRQLNKNGVVASEVASNWRVQVIDSLPHAALKLSDSGNDMHFKISWDPHLISMFNKVFPSTSRTWFRETGWIIPYSLTNLRVITRFIQRHVPHCEIETPLSEVIGVLGKQKWREWKTMVVPYGTNSWMVNRVAEPLVPLLPKSRSIDISTVVELTNLGIDVDPRIRRRLRSRYGIAAAMLAYNRRAAFRLTDRNNKQVLKYCHLAGVKSVTFVTSFDAVEIPVDDAADRDSAARINQSLIRLLKSADIAVQTVTLSSTNVTNFLACINADLVIANMTHQLQRVPPRVRTLKYYQHANL